MTDEQRAKLREIYDRIPPMKCKGLCQASCGPTGMTHGEAEAMAELKGIPVPPESDRIFLTQRICPFLSGDGRCEVYDARPMICRLWGVVESMPCPHGCVPEGGRLSDVEGFTLMAQVDELMGVEGGMTEDAVAALFSDPEIRREVEAFIAQGMTGEAKGHAAVAKAGGYEKFRRGL